MSFWRITRLRTLVLFRVGCKPPAKCGAHAVLAKQQALGCDEALYKALLYYRVPGGAVTWLVFGTVLVTGGIQVVSVAQKIGPSSLADSYVRILGNINPFMTKETNLPRRQNLMPSEFNIFVAGYGKSSATASFGLLWF